MKKLADVFFEALVWAPRLNLVDVEYAAAVDDAVAHRFWSRVPPSAAIETDVRPSDIVSSPPSEDDLKDRAFPIVHSEQSPQRTPRTRRKP